MYITNIIDHYATMVTEDFLLTAVDAGGFIDINLKKISKILGLILGRNSQNTFWRSCKYRVTIRATHSGISLGHSDSVLELGIRHLSHAVAGSTRQLLQPEQVR